MKYLMNLSTHPEDIGKFGSAPIALLSFLDQHLLEGVEAINYESWDPKLLPSKCIKGYHMPFWPLWLPFWEENHSWILQTFGDVETAALYYGGQTKMALVKAYRSHLQTAIDMGAEYAVFHISHCDLEECFSYQFKTASDKIVEAFISLLNLALKEINLPQDFELLFENQWWPGLDFLQKDLMKKLMEEINHSKLGFMLDTGHFMNAHRDIRTEEEALRRLHAWYAELGSLKPYVKGMHLSSSMSGEYVTTTATQYKDGALEKHPALNLESPFFERYFASFSHIGEIDRHQVFEDSKVINLIAEIQPKWLVLEFMTATKEEAAHKIGRQLNVLNRFK